MFPGFQPRPGQRQFVKFTFFKVAPEWRRLDGDERHHQIAELAAVVESWAGRQSGSLLLDDGNARRHGFHDLAGQLRARRHPADGG